MSQRFANWTSTELNVLVTYLEANRDLVTGELGKSIKTPSDLTKEWEHVAHLVNSVGGQNRPAASIRKKWRDLKSKTKGKAADYSKERRKTGGGSSDAPSLCPIEERIMSLIGQSCSDGILSEDIHDTFDFPRNARKQSDIGMPFHEYENSPENQPVLQDCRATDDFFRNTAPSCSDRMPSEAFPGGLQSSVSPASRTGNRIVFNDLTPIHIKQRTDSTSNVRSENFRSRKQQELQETRKTVVDNQKGILEALQSIDKKFDQLISSQNQIISEMRLNNLLLARICNVELEEEAPK